MASISTLDQLIEWFEQSICTDTFSHLRFQYCFVSTKRVYLSIVQYYPGLLVDLAARNSRYTSWPRLSLG